MTSMQLSQAVPTVGQVAVLAIVEFAPGRVWRGIRHLMFGRWPLHRTPGLRFGKVMGSGYEGGFGLRPSGTHQGLFCSFDDDAAADAFLESSKQVQLFRDAGVQWLTLKLRAYATRGAWSGVVPAGVSRSKPEAGPIASLTRGTIRPMRARSFWSHSPAAQRAIADHPGCLLSIGLGEAPLFRQCTFTIWKDEAALDGYARSGAHRVAADAAAAGGHFSESMFTRFVPYAARGAWKGVAADTFGER